VQPELDEHHALAVKACFERRDLLVGTAPLLLAGEALDALHQHAPVPGAVEDRHAAPARQRREEARQVVMALLVGRRRGELLDPDVAVVELGRHPLDRAALAARVPALHENTERRAEPLAAELPAQLEAPRREQLLGALEPRLVLVLRDLRRRPGLVQAPHGAGWYAQAAR
jgi:hypothetical protein